MDKIRAFIVGGDVAVKNLLHDYGVFEVVDGGRMPPLNAFDIVVFTGGEDVAPEMYGEENVYSSWLAPHRDMVEFNIFQRTKDTHYHFGICRGLQLLAVANGHTLWQDISGHQLSNGHSMTTRDGHVVKGVTSVHHQAIRQTVNNKHCVLAWEKYDEPVEARGSTRIPYSLDKVVEAAWFEPTRSFGVQGHPEYRGASKEYKDYVLYHLLEDKLTSFYANKYKGHA